MRNFFLLNNDECLMVLQTDHQMLKKVLNYHVYASKLLSNFSSTELLSKITM